MDTNQGFMRWRRSCPSVAAKLLSVRLRGKLRCLFSQVSPVTSACHPPNSPTSSCHHRQLLPHFSSPQPGCCYILTSSSTATLKSVPFLVSTPSSSIPLQCPHLSCLLSLLLLAFHSLTLCCLCLLLVHLSVHLCACLFYVQLSPSPL